MRSHQKKLLFILNVDYFLISHRLQIALSALKEGYEVHVAAKDTGKMKDLKNLGMITHPIRLERSKIEINSLFLTIFDIKRVIELVKPTIVHLISIKPVILGGLALHFVKQKPFIVSSISGLGQIYIYSGLISTIKKCITTLLYSIAFFHKRLLVIFQNNSDQNLLSLLTGLSIKKTYLISGSGVDLRLFKYSPLPKGKPIILFTGRLLRSKGIFEFVAAAKKLKNHARFVICGEPDFDSKDSISKELLNTWIEANYFEYWGFLDNMHDIISKSTIVVLPSYREGLPKILCESAACGRPVITTDVPGCRDAIIVNKTGLLVPVGNSNILSEKILLLISNPKKLKEMSLNCRKLAKSKFDIIEIVKEHLAIYDKGN